MLLRGFGRGHAAANNPASPEMAARRLAFASLSIVSVLTLANLLFNLIAASRGYGFPYNWFLFRPDDNFADFFSLLGSYPDGGRAVVPDREGLHAILPESPPSTRVTGEAAIVTNLHMMPFSTLISLAALQAMRLVDPVALFLCLVLSLLTWWSLLSWAAARTRREAVAWVLLGLISYPTLFMIARGNLHAGLAAILIIHAILLGLQRRSLVAVTLLLALAVNIRPNAIIFSLPLLAFYWPQRWRFIGALGAFGISALTISMTISTTAYPAYTLGSFLEGLENYADLYVAQGWGLQYGSSLYSAIRALFRGYDPAYVTAAACISLALFVGGMLAWLRCKISDAELIFVTASAYCLGTTVLGDYHLMVFLVVPLAFALGRDAAARADWLSPWVAILVTCLILSPKNYIFQGPISAQVVLNPILLLTGALLILGLGLWRQSRPGKPEEADPLPRAG